MDSSKAIEYLVKRISPQETIEDLLRFPRYFEIETVNACNARCPMCTIADWERGSPTMKDSLFEKIAGELEAHADEVKRVSLYRDGEPLLDKKMPRRVHALKSRGIRRVGISTNVSLLNEKMATDLLDAGIDEIILSIDSLKKTVFEAIRVRLKFEEVLENALRFIDLRNRIRPQTSIWVRMIRQEGNFHEWPDYERYWRPRLAKNDRLYYLNIHNWGGQLAGFEPVSHSVQPTVPCVALWSLMVIFSNGDVPMCNVDYNNRFPTGNVRDNTIAKVWHSAIANQRRELHLTGNKGRIPPCDNCTVWDEPPDKESIVHRFLDET